MGSNHAKTIIAGDVSDMELTAMCDISETRRDFLKKKYPDIPVFEKAEDLYQSGLVDAVIIATPHYDHPPLAIAAFAAGLHVLSEKPAGVYTKQVLEMNAAAEKSGKIFGIMYNQRTNPIYQKIREFIQTGELGNIKRVNWIITDWYRSQFYHNSCTWRSHLENRGGRCID